jgi:hypothetical protein
VITDDRAFGRGEQHVFLSSGILSSAPAAERTCDEARAADSASEGTVKATSHETAPRPENYRLVSGEDGRRTEPEWRAIGSPTKRLTSICDAGNPKSHQRARSQSMSRPQLRFLREGRAPANNSGGGYCEPGRWGVAEMQKKGLIHRDISQAIRW